MFAKFYEISAMTLQDIIDETKCYEQTHAGVGGGGGYNECSSCISDFNKGYGEK